MPDDLAPALRGHSPEGCGKRWRVAPTVQRYVDAYCKGGLDGLRHSSVQKAVSDLAAFPYIIRASFKEHLSARLPEACDRIEKLTGIRRSPTR